MLDIDWSKLIRIDYWLEGVAGGFSVTPPVEEGSAFFWTYLYLFIAFFSFGVVVRVLKSFMDLNHPLQPRLSFWGNSIIWISFWALVWFLLRQLSIGFLGARFWLLILFTWALVIKYFAIRYFITKYRIEKLYFEKYRSCPPGISPIG